MLDIKTKKSVRHKTTNENTLGVKRVPHGGNVVASRDQHVQMTLCLFKKRVNDFMMITHCHKWNTTEHFLQAVLQ